MNTTDLVHFPHMDAPGRPAPRRAAFVPSPFELAESVRNSILCARNYLCAEQRVDGSWAGETTGEVTTLSQLVLLYAFLGREQEELVELAARAILRQQLAAGGWARAREGSFDLDASVLAYFALKLGGEDACGSNMAKARHAIRAHGGADGCGELTRRWLALLGQIDYELCEPVMPEWLLSSSLSQDATSQELLELAARSAVWSVRPRRQVDLSLGVRELFIESPRSWTPAARRTKHVAARFTRLWSHCERAGLVPFRKRALERASFLLTEAVVESPFLELGFEDLAWQWIALKALGFRDSCRAIRACEQRLNSLIAIDEAADEARSQPLTTLTTDTSLALAAIAASGLSREQPVVAAGVCWIVEHRLRKPLATMPIPEMVFLLRALTAVEAVADGDGKCLPPELCVRDEFEQVDAASDAAEAVPAATVQHFVDRLVSGLSVEQRPDGGWSHDVFPGRLRNRGINHAFGRRVGASADELTGMVLECITAGHVCVRAVCERAIACLRSTQHGDGRWDSATHARYVHGTSCAVRGLIAAGLSADDPLVTYGVNWLLLHQLDSGGWGEAGGSRGGEQEFLATEPTAIQTAWAVLALVAAGMANHEATRRGVGFLVNSQDGFGGWCDSALVERDATDGPWYQNRLHSTCWSLLALAQWARAISKVNDNPVAALRLVGNDSAR